MTAAERVARTIAGALLDGEFGDGSTLPNEVEMSRRYGVGRSTVREALRILEGWGVVTMKQGRHGGPVATRPDVAALSTHFGIVMQFGKVTLAEVFETRRVLDQMLAGIAAAQMSDEDVVLLGEAIKGLSDHIYDKSQYERFNEQFYDVLIGAAGNRALQVLVRAIQSWGSKLTYAAGVPPEWRRESVALRSSVFRAIASGSRGEAERQMDEYRVALKRWFEEHRPAELTQVVDVIGRVDPDA